MLKLMILAVLLLTGCSTTQPVYVPTEKVVYHPPRPAPVRAHNPNWVVITDKTIHKYPSGSVFIALEYNDSIAYREWLEEVNHFIDKQQHVLCIYRADMKEALCGFSEKDSEKVLNTGPKSVE